MKGKFFFGFILGVAAGIAAKYLYDNQEEILEVVGEKIGEAKEGFGDFVDYAANKASKAGKAVSKKMAETSEFAKEQLQEFKNAFSKDDAVTQE